MSNNMIGHQPRTSSIKDIVRHYLSDIVYGGNDGIVTTFAVISGSAGANISLTAMLVITVVNLLADGFSMAASSFLAIRSKAEAYGLHRGSIEPSRHALVTYVSFICFGAMPLVGYLIHDLLNVEAFLLSAILTGLTMFVLGALRSLVGIRRWFYTGFENLFVGTIASLVAYYCGKLMAYLVH
jgi:VIT1/CCC1 family predicted Fe2+/Mn2+ transporter